MRHFFRYALKMRVNPSVMHQKDSQMSDKFQTLAKLGAGDFEHLDGSLIMRQR